MSLLTQYSIGCIGTGNMGSAILTGLRNTDAAVELVAYDNDTTLLEDLVKDLSLKKAESAQDCIKKSDIIILAVKPGTITSLLTSVKDLCTDKIVVSVAAGITIDTLKKSLGAGTRTVRVMPNTPSLVQQGMSVISTDDNISADETAAVREIFNAVGRTLVLPEDKMDAVTGLSGSGPAYIFTMIQAMTDAGVQSGLTRDDAQLLAAQTVQGAASLVLNSDAGPMALRGRVTSPGGTTIEGVHILERAGFSGIIMDAVLAAVKRSKELGSQ